MKTLYETIEIDRMSKGLTVDNYCAKAGIGVITYYRLQQNKPHASTIFKLAKESGIDAKELLDLPMTHDE